MSKTRRIISFVLASILTIAGAAGAVFLVFFAHYHSFRLMAGSGLVLGIGLAWLYSDFIDATPNDERG